MLEIRSLTAAVSPTLIEAEGQGSPMPARREPPESPPLEPAVTLDLSPEARRSASQATEAAATAQARYRRDPDTRQMVFQVVDPTSGNVVDQLPSEAVLRARTYARESEAQQTTEIGTTVARTA
ncbi:hypothetical protein EOE48_14435 [Methylobacterium oryzihabitans]|uniref:Flagellar protein FlaG n=2 Tax=Methylobacterium oryzihabitans TaxID=2499852 RepID=A0A3S3U744_9HYPH|nr:hypothetical protein EOE48_14435 [Methylobacterium oryzihabitans]